MNKISKTITAWMSDKVFLFIFFIAVRLPYFYFVYPGLMFFDSTSSIAQFYGIKTFAATLSSTPEWILTDHHLIFFTLFMGGFVKLGELLGSMNFGIFLYVMIQVLVSNAILADCLFIVKNRVSKTWYVISILFLALMPPITLWQLTVSKDSWFSIIVLYLCCKTYQIIDTDFVYLNKKRNLALYILVSALCCLMKHQGAYLVAVSSAVLFAFYKKKAWKAGTVLLVSGLFFLSIFPNLILPAFHVSKTGRQEALGFMFQQTARYVADYGPDVTPEEREAIDALLPYDELPELYVPDRQDKVKFQFNQQASSGEVIRYARCWFKMFFKHPDAYIYSTLDVCGDFFGGRKVGFQYVPAYLRDSYIIQENPVFTMKNVQPDELQQAFREKMDELGELPIIHIFFNYAFYTRTIAICLVLLVLRLKVSVLAAFVPVLLSICILVISPVVQFRYYLPVLYAWPFIVGLAVGRRHELLSCFSARNRAKAAGFFEKHSALLQGLLLGGAFLILLVFMAVRIDNLLDQDISTQLVYSRLLRDEHAILSKNWYYATELRVLGYNLIFEPLFFLFSNWRIVRILGQALWYLVLLASIWYFCGKIGLRKYYGLIATAFIIPYSEQYFCYFLCNINYIPFLSISFISMGMMFDFAHCDRKRKRTVLLALSGLLAFGAGLGGSRQLYTTYAPLFLAAAAYFLLKGTGLEGFFAAKKKKSEEYSFLVIAASGLVFNLAGYLVNNTLLASIYDFRSYDTAFWTGFQGEKLGEVISGLFQNLGMLSGNEDLRFAAGRVFSFAAVHSAMCFLLAGLSVFAVCRVLKRRKEVRFETVLLGLFLLSSFLISVVLFGFTTQYYWPRFDLLWTVFLYPFLALYFAEVDMRHSYARIAVVVLIVGIGICSADSYKNYAEKDNTGELKNIINVLRANGYKNGYAPFHPGGMITELSNGEIEIWYWINGMIAGDIGDADNIIRWAQKKSHYYEHPSGKVFWVFKKDEAQKFSLPIRAGDDFVIYRSSEELNRGILDPEKKRMEYVVYGFNSYDEMYSLMGGYVFSDEKTMQSGGIVRSNGGVTLFPDSYLMVCRGENLSGCAVELSYRRTVRYRHMDVVEDNWTPLEAAEIEQGEDYIVASFRLDERAIDFTAEFSNQSGAAARISSIEFTKPTGWYADFYRNSMVENGADDHGVRTIYSGGASYGPYRMLVPGTYLVECGGSGLEKLSFDCVYTDTFPDGQPLPVQIERSVKEQRSDRISYYFSLDTVRENVETRFFNKSGETVTLTGLKIKRVGAPE